MVEMTKEMSSRLVFAHGDVYPQYRVKVLCDKIDVGGCQQTVDGSWLVIVPVLGSQLVQLCAYDPDLRRSVGHIRVHPDVDGHAVSGEGISLTGTLVLPVTDELSVARLLALVGIEWSARWEQPILMRTVQDLAVWDGVDDDAFVGLQQAWTSLTAPVTGRVLRQACRLAAAWIRHRSPGAEDPLANWRCTHPLLVRDPRTVFALGFMWSTYADGLMGAGTPELRTAMSRAAHADRDAFEANDAALLRVLARVRGRPVETMRAELGTFLSLRAERAQGPPIDAPLTWLNGSYTGSRMHLHYGLVVGSCFGIDPVFAALLKPTGGLVGPGRYAFNAGETMLGFHAAYHDAAGYMHTWHRCGPGFDYLGQEGTDTSSPMTGQVSGVRAWRRFFQHHRNNPLANSLMVGLVVSVVWLHRTWTRLGSFLSCVS